MKIQSFHVLVPTRNKCVNNCPCCVSRLHENCENDRIHAIRTGDALTEAGQQILDDYTNRIKFVKDNDCNAAVLTGTGEPIMNREFLKLFGKINKNLPNPFYSIDFQTTGVMLDDENLKFLKKEVGVTTIALSLFNIFASGANFDALRTNSKLYFDIDEICKKIKEHGFNLRLCIMLTKVYDEISPAKFFDRIKELGADYATFKKLYKVEGELAEGNYKEKADEVNRWIFRNASSDEFVRRIDRYIETTGNPLNVMPFGTMRYSINGISTVLDRHCMGKREEPGEDFKFFILKEDCRLYSEWDDSGSLIF